MWQTRKKNNVPQETLLKAIKSFFWLSQKQIKCNNKRPMQKLPCPHSHNREAGLPPHSSYWFFLNDMHKKVMSLSLHCQWWLITFFLGHPTPHPRKTLVTDTGHPRETDISQQLVQVQSCSPCKSGIQSKLYLHHVLGLNFKGPWWLSARHHQHRQCNQV